jgi:hypothetical protein
MNNSENNCSETNEIFNKLEAVGIRIAEENKPAFLSAVDKVGDAFLNKIVNGLVSELPSGGIKNFEWAPFKNALIDAEPQFDDALNGSAETLFDMMIKGAS